jgi:hypothetical protein
VVIEFNISLGERDWEQRIGGWRCDALLIPSAVVTTIYYDGKKADTKFYSIERNHIRWSKNDVPKDIVVGISLRENLPRLEEEKLNLEKQNLKLEQRKAILTLIGLVSTIFFSSLAFLAGSRFNNSPSSLPNRTSQEGQTSSPNISALPPAVVASPTMPPTSTPITSPSNEFPKFKNNYIEAEILGVSLNEAGKPQISLTIENITGEDLLLATNVLYPAISSDAGESGNCFITNGIKNANIASNLTLNQLYYTTFEPGIKVTVNLSDCRVNLSPKASSININMPLIGLKDNKQEPSFPLVISKKIR